MADYGLDLPFLGEAAPPQAQAGQPTAADDLTSQWSNWMSQPANRAAIMQLGVSLLQPVGIGQTPAGQVGQALGDAGEAVGRVAADERAQAELDRRNRETDSRVSAREAGAANAETRANAALTTANARSAMTESQIAVNRARVEASLARTNFLQERVRALQEETARKPDDIQSQIALREARAALARAQTELALERSSIIAPDSETRRLRAENQTRNINSQIETRGRLADTAEANAATRRQQVTNQSQQAGLGDIARAQSDYRKEVEAIRKRNADARLLDPKAQQEPVPTFGDWRARAGQSPTATPTPGREITATDAQGNKVKWDGTKWILM